jgi:hypothetical protein
VVTDAQARKLMDEISRQVGVGVAALRAGMHRNTARRYLALGKLPSELKVFREWRTREDPFAEDWEEMASRLAEAPELEAKALFEDLVARRPARYTEGQLRTLQRRIKQWRAEHGPEKEIFLPQQHRPGEAMQTDFTRAGELGVTIAGERFEHLLCQSVLPYSNWQSVVVCQSESMLALRRGVQEAIFRLGRVPQWHQTDNSTAATHELTSGKRGFNAEYAEMMAYFGMKPRTIGIGKSHQNGDIEAANGALKRRLEQHLLLRGCRDFESVDRYEGWIAAALEAANAQRAPRFAEELAAMTSLAAERLPEFRELPRVPVSIHGTIQVQRNTYSVPSRLTRERVTVRIFEMSVEVYYGGRRQLVTERLAGERKHQIDYRHVIWSLVKKPWAFARYRYREALFPTASFRRAYEALAAGLSERQTELEYLRVLHLAAATRQYDVEAALELLAADGRLPTFAEVRALVHDRPLEMPAMAPLEVDLESYDALLTEAVQ